MFPPRERTSRTSPGPLAFPSLSAAIDRWRMFRWQREQSRFGPCFKSMWDAAEDKRVQKPSTASYDAILAARGDPLIIPKLGFFLAIARSFNPFSQRYQTDEPALPFLAKDLTELLMSLLWRFIKRELLQDRTPLQLTKMDISEEKNWVSLKSLV
ncbi:unnamed protein product [Leuciscus chuanchicus]